MLEILEFHPACLSGLKEMYVAQEPDLALC